MRGSFSGDLKQHHAEVLFLPFTIVVKLHHCGESSLKSFYKYTLGRFQRTLFCNLVPNLTAVVPYRSLQTTTVKSFM